MIGRRGFLTGSAGLAGAAALTGCEARDRPLYAADAQPAGYPTVQAVEYMGELLRERSEGRLGLQMFAGGQLGPERDTLEITMFGGLDINRVNIAPLNPIVPETIVPALPFVFRSIPHMRAAMDGAPGRKILAALEREGLIGLCFYDSGARSFYNKRGPIETPDDLAGLKIRVQNSDLYVSMVEALGGDAVPMSFSEVYTAIVQGTIDGAENNWPSYDTTRHFEAAPFYSLTEHIMAPEVLVVSARRWAKLSDEDRALMRRCAEDSVPYMRELWDARVEASRETVLAGGVQVTEIPDKSAFQARMDPVYDRFVTPALRDLVDEVQAVEVPDV